MKKTLILDTKTKSPFGWESEFEWSENFDFAVEHGDMIAVHSMGEFGGYDTLVKIARSNTKKPIIVKGIHRTDDEIKKYIDMGADYVLVVGRIPDKSLWEHCMIEPTAIAELKNYDWKGTEIGKLPLVVWNARNLVTGLPKAEKFDEYYGKVLFWVCQASMIESLDDIHPDADAIMVGTHMRKIVKEFRDIPTEDN